MTAGKVGPMPVQSTPGVDFLQLVPPITPTGGLTNWLARAVRSAIADGRLPPSSVLPPSRVLAADLGVSRGVVVQAYQRLADEGLIDTRQGSGTTVLAAGDPSAGGRRPVAGALSSAPLPLRRTGGRPATPTQPHTPTRPSTPTQPHTPTEPSTPTRPPTPSRPSLPLPGRHRWSGIEIDLSP